MDEVDNAKLLELRDFCKKMWTIRISTDEFLTLIKKEFSKKEIEVFLKYYIEHLGSDPKDMNSSFNKYLISVISEDPSMVFANLDLENMPLVCGSRKIIEMSDILSFNNLPVYSEKSSQSALNALIVVLMNNNKVEMKKTVFQLARSPYFSVLVSSGRLFFPEKFRQAQLLFKMNDPFDSPISKLPITQVHLVMALFPDYLMEHFYYNDKFKTAFFMFAIFQLITLDESGIKIVATDLTLTALYISFINYYLSNPSYIVSHFLNTFQTTHFKSKRIFKVIEIIRNDEWMSKYFSDDYMSNTNQNIFLNLSKKSNELNETENDREIISNFLKDYNNAPFSQIDIFSFKIIHQQCPNGILPSYEASLNFLFAKPETFSIDTLIEDALHYPSFACEIANIFMQKLVEKDIQSSVNLATQLLKRIDDVRLTWIGQHVFFPIMTALYDCFNEIVDENHFEILFFLFISFYEGCTRPADDDVISSFRKFNSNFDSQLNSYLENFLNRNNEIVVPQNIDFLNDKPINKLYKFLSECKEKNEIDVLQLKKFPYLFVSAFIWGIKTNHPNSLKLLSLKFPNYKVLKRLFIYLSTCHQYKNEKSSFSIMSIRTTDYSFELLTRFKPMDESDIRILIIDHLQLISIPAVKIVEYQGIVLSWRAWIKIFSIEKFIIILFETLCMAYENEFDQLDSRTIFIFAERVLSTVFQNPIKTNICQFSENQMKFNSETNRFEKVENLNINKNCEYLQKVDNDYKTALWTTLHFVNNYEGGFSEAIGIASFCLLLIISINNDWKSEFKKVFDFSNKMMKNSDWKSLRYSFGTNFLFISMSILDVQDLVHIDVFDLDFLQMNWRLGINYFFIQSEIKKLKEMNFIPQFD